ncbi:MSCRAMM family protein [Eubacterium aggregans]|uniref:MSCRAMM family protein n=1 Tax=Eubacterium aggregans TaxID=81409 RepID=UPI003F320CDB
MAYANAHNINTSVHTLYYTSPNGTGAKPYQRLVALSGERYGTIRVTKTSTETGAAVPGTTFLIDESVRVTTTSDGSVSVGAVTVGNHTVREIGVPSGYQLSGETKTVYVSPDNVVTASFSNHHYGYIKIGKKDAESGAMVPGETFEVRNAGGALVGTYTTWEDGSITTSDLEAGTYTITETAVPAPYWLGEESTRTGTVTVGWN